MMRGFFKDYGKLFVESGRFYRKHWLGCIIVYVISFMATFAYLDRDHIKYKLKTRFHKD